LGRLKAAPTTAVAYACAVAGVLVAAEDRFSEGDPPAAAHAAAYAAALEADL